jgi:hypothetical protein
MPARCARVCLRRLRGRRVKNAWKIAKTVGLYVAGEKLPAKGVPVLNRVPTLEDP